MTLLTATSPTRIEFTHGPDRGDWDMSRPPGQRFTLNTHTVTRSEDVAGFLNALTRSDTYGALPAHRVLMGELLQNLEFTNLAQARGAFDTLLTDPEVCFQLLDTSTLTPSELRHSAHAANTLTGYLVRLAIMHGFLHVLYAEDLLEAVEHYHADNDLTAEQASELFTFLLLFTPGESHYWDNHDIATFIGILALVVGFDTTYVTDDDDALQWVLQTTHDNLFLGVPYQPTTQPPALHKDTLAYLLLVMVAQFKGTNDVTHDEHLTTLVNTVRQANWHTRTLTPLTVGFLVRLWAVHEWLCASEPNSDIRCAAMKALANVSWHIDRSPEQVSIHATTAHAAAVLGWDTTRTLHALALIDDIGPGCTVEDMVAVIEYLDGEN